MPELVTLADVRAAVARANATLAVPHTFAALQQPVHLVRQRGAILLLQAEPAGKLEFIGGRKAGLAQQREQTISE